MNICEIPERVGIISGRGKLPILIAERVRKINSATRIFSVGFAGEVDKEIKTYSTEFITVRLGELEKVIDFFKLHKVEKIFIAGLVSHKRIFDNRVKLDKLSKEMFNKIADKKANSILCAIADELKKEREGIKGIEVLPMNSILGDSIATEGYLTNTSATASNLEDVDFGWKIGIELSKLDIGQTIVVKDKCVVAVESIEGTDRCILRAGKLAGENTVVIKLAKHSQDMRFDLPVIGPKTIRIMNRIKSRCIAVEANKTCIIDKAKVVELANKYGICIIARSRNE
ncbi:MAG: UDP-2,3-diacylglucosamine diphosphatase LpxI [Elusimicrobiota bacterium]|nr:UDP-2,3-diacylglucosamine diphosphatase LpxI [Elusimicrobiota bacterium]